jgi:hypothetical protein
MWPPELQELKDDLGLTDDRDDASLSVLLDAAVAYVERELYGEFDFDGTLAGLVPFPTQDVSTGTIRLAGRWHNRRRSPDGLIDMGELGNARISSYDPDIERMLGIGRFRRPMV